MKTTAEIKKIAYSICNSCNEIGFNQVLEGLNTGIELCQKEYEEKLRWIPVEESKPEIKEEQYQIQVLNRKNDIQVIWFGTEYDLSFINRFKAWRYFL